MNEKNMDEIRSYLELVAKVRKLESIIDDYREDIAVVLSEACPSDERHCGCVPILRDQISCYQQTLILIITAAEAGRLEEIKDIINNSLRNNVDIDDVALSEARAVGEYWVNRLYQLEDRCDTLEKEYADVCKKRLEAAEVFTKQILTLESKIREWEAYYDALTA